MEAIKVLPVISKAVTERERGREGEREHETLTNIVSIKVRIDVALSEE